TALNEATSELSTQRERFLRLRDDFKYNLRVLEERDKELERYDALAARAQTEESARREEVSELRIEIAKLQDDLENRRRVKEDIEVQYQRRGVEHRVKLEKVQSMMENEIQKLREENETLKWDLQREMRKREHEFHLNKELEVHAKAHSQATEASEGLYQQAQKEIKRRDWDLKNTTAMKDSRIKEFEDKLKQMESNYKKRASLQQHAELERRSREKEDALGLMREAHTRELQEISELQAQLDRMILEQERREKSYMDDFHQRDQQIQELRVQLEITRSGWDTYITQISKENVAKVTELLSAGEREAKVRAELERCKEDIERYKQQVSSGMQSEQALKQKRVQLELDWERRCEEVHSEHYLRSEELIQSLTQARDQVIDSSSFPSEEIRRLQQQNSTLRAVVAEMRKEMENLSQQMPIAQSQTINPEPSTAGTTDYSQTLEKEILELKAKCCDLEERLEESSKIVNTASITALAFPVSPDNAYLQNHIRLILVFAGGLQVEKVASAAALKKQEVRLAHLESACHSKHMENESLRLEMENHKRAAAAEEARLKQRVANVCPVFKSEMVKQLQEANLSLRQQLLLLQSSARGGAVGDVATLQSKLKQAAQLISSLSQDKKRQLIEMGNRLRAQLIEAGLEGYNSPCFVCFVLIHIGYSTH
uniref:Coiled-coil domain containing 57 n=1 Tax=Sinocyclocheilus anshuiensis TaxID=1608454 RepID=A0A671NS18_9TELE